SGSNYSEIRGLWYRQPGLAGLLSLFMLALAGFPPMAGFAAKYYLFYAALQGGHPELLIIGVLASVLGMYYYLRVIATMFMEQEVVAADATTVAPVTNNRRVSARLEGTGSRASRRGTTAVAVKPSATAVASAAKRAVAGTDEGQWVSVNWRSWAAIWMGADVTGGVAGVLAVVALE